MVKRYSQTAIPGLKVNPVRPDNIAYKTIRGDVVTVDGVRLDVGAGTLEAFGGQAQEGDRLGLPTKSKFGEYWIERVYKTVNDKRYGPYLLQRWRDKDGKKRSRYLGKAPQENSGKH